MPKWRQKFVLLCFLGMSGIEKLVNRPCVILRPARKHKWCMEKIFFLVYAIAYLSFIEDRNMYKS